MLSVFRQSIRKIINGLDISFLKLIWDYYTVARGHNKLQWVIKDNKSFYSLRSGKYNYLLRNDTVFMSILLTEVFDKVFEVWLLKLHEPEYFMNNIIICFQLFLHVFKLFAKEHEIIMRTKEWF